MTSHKSTFVKNVMKKYVRASGWYTSCAIYPIQKAQTIHPLGLPIMTVPQHRGYLQVIARLFIQAREVIIICLFVRSHISPSYHMFFELGRVRRTKEEVVEEVGSSSSSSSSSSDDARLFAGTDSPAIGCDICTRTQRGSTSALEHYRQYICASLVEAVFDR